MRKINNLEEWKEKLRTVGIRCTEQRLEILNILIEQTKPLTAKEIYNKLEVAKIKLRLSTIYRTLNKLEENNLVKKLDLNSEEGKFELIGEEHHHHLVCVACNEIIALDCPLEKFEIELSSETGYKIADHRIKFYGVCPDCQNVNE
ncbi:MAG: Fur family transcriptional regulator [Bacillota bacterium]